MKKYIFFFLWFVTIIYTAIWTFENPEKIEKIKIILAGMLAPTSYGTNYKKEFDQIYPELSKKYNLPLIPFLLEGVALNPELNQSDGIHPNEKGTLVISETIKRSILKTKKIK